MGSGEEHAPAVTDGALVFPDLGLGAIHQNSILMPALITRGAMISWTRPK